MSTLSDLASRWLKEAETLERYRDERGAEVCRLHAWELQEAVKRHETEVLDLGQAAELSGYSRDHLRALVRDGTIPNVGRRGSPRVSRADVPTKPGGKASGGFDAAAEARRILRKGPCSAKT